MKMATARKIRRFVKHCMPHGMVNFYIKRREKSSPVPPDGSPPDGRRPVLFNSRGEPIDMFFLKDNHMAHIPYGMPPNPYFLWDRNNYGLDVHFYTHSHMLRPYANASRRYGWLVESEAIVPGEYQAIYESKSLWSEFERIFTFSAKALDLIPNACFAPASSVWYGVWPEAGGKLDMTAYERKTKKTSLVSSHKKMTPLHSLRIQLALTCKNDTGIGVDTYGTFDGGRGIPTIAESLTEYRFSFAVENAIAPCYFTEKLLNCFAAMTVPIYLGAPDIANFFNPDGIIFLSEKNCGNIRDIRDITSLCTEQEYLRRLDAVKDNFNRVMDYCSLEGYIYNKYLRGDPFFTGRHHKDVLPISPATRQTYV